MLLLQSTLRVKCCVDVTFFSVHLPQKVFELLEFHLHNFQPSLHTSSPVNHLLVGRYILPVNELHYTARFTALSCIH